MPLYSNTAAVLIERVARKLGDWKEGTNTGTANSTFVDTTSRTPRRLGQFDADDRTEADMIAHERWPNALRVTVHPVVVQATQPTAPGTSTSQAVSYRSHTVQPGDSLSRIALQYGQPASSWTKLYAINRDVVGSNPNRIKAGMILRVPSDWVGPARPPTEVVKISKGWIVASMGIGITIAAYAIYRVIKRRRRRS